jgi:hypothetical protein
MILLFVSFANFAVEPLAAQAVPSGRMPTAKDAKDAKTKSPLLFVLDAGCDDLENSLPDFFRCHAIGLHHDRRDARQMRY